MKKILLLLSLVLMAGCAVTPQSSPPAQPITFGTSTLTLIDESISTIPFEKADNPYFFATAVTPLPYSFTIKIVTQNWKAPTTSVEVSYPVMAYPGHEALAEAFNAAIRDNANTEAANFLQEVVAGSADTSRVYSDYGNDIYVAGWLNFASTKLVSAQLVVSTYYAGAAHPTTQTYGFNFDLAQSKELQLSELFTPGSNYLAALSKLAIAELDEQREREDYGLDPDWVKQGAGPQADNFHTVNLTTDGLLITFDAYDVDAYAAGPHEILIPYENLKGIIAPEILLMLK